MSARSICLGMVTAVLAVFLAACGQGPQQPNPASSVGALSPASSNASVAGASLIVRPATIDGCTPNQSIVATVSWHSTAQKNRVMVSAPGQAAPKLFSESGYSGSAKTGDWVGANTTFTLVNADTGDELARRVVTETPCSK